MGNAGMLWLRATCSFAPRGFMPCQREVGRDHKVLDGGVLFLTCACIVKVFTEHDAGIHCLSLGETHVGYPSKVATLPSICY